MTGDESHGIRRVLVATLVVVVVLSAVGVAGLGSTGSPTSSPDGERRGSVSTIDGTNPVLQAVPGTDTALSGIEGSVTPLASELVAHATLSSTVVLRGGFFVVVAGANATYNTSSGTANLDSTFDVNITDTDGVFSVQGEVIGNVDATRALLTFERYATSEGWSTTPPPGVGDNTSVDGNRSSAAIRSNARPPDASPPGQVSVASTGALTVVSGPTTVSAPAPLQLRPWRRLGISFMDLYWSLATLLLGLVLVGVLPRFSRRVADVGASDPLRSGGAGLVVVLLVPLALLVLGLSLFGIPAALAGAATYFVFGWVGAVYGRFTVGMWVLGAIPQALAYAGVDARRVENRWAGLLVGTFLVGVAVIIPIIGTFVDGLVVLLGLGAVTRIAYGSYRRTERDATPDGHTDVVGPDSE